VRTLVHFQFGTRDCLAGTAWLRAPWLAAVLCITWALFGQTNDINETIIEGIAAGMVSSGLHAVGYRFVNMDAGVWAPERSATGEIVADPTKFPSGMAALSVKIHGMGLKMGLVRLMPAAACPVRRRARGLITMLWRLAHCGSTRISATVL
jgi:hypothetical protein